MARNKTDGLSAHEAAQGRNGSRPAYTVAELFCGCGGFSHGFKRSGRFRVVLGNDIKKHALATFSLNHTEDGIPPAIIAEDVRSVSAQRFAAELLTHGVQDLDCLIGGPPCQGFSQMKRGEARNGNALLGFRGYDKLSHDPRNDLVLRYLEIAQVLHPRVLVIENVPQFFSHFHNGKRGGIVAEVEELLGAMGYETACEIVNAADYGVPQLRERALIIASRVGKIEIPDATHTSAGDLFAASRQLTPWITVEEAISDLPAPPLTNVDKLGGRPLSLYATQPCSPYAEQMRTAPAFPFNHISRTYSKDVTGIISHMNQGETWDDASERMRKKYQRLVERSRLPGEEPAKTRQPLTKSGEIIPAFFKDYYWSAYTRLAPNKPALTVTADANFLGCGRYTHPTDDRGITMREAARLQSFDDAFKFITSETPGKERTRIGRPARAEVAFAE